MAGLAQSTRNNTIRIMKVKNKKEFIKDFNDKIPSKEFLDMCSNAAKKAGEKDDR